MGLFLGKPEEPETHISPVAPMLTKSPWRKFNNNNQHLRDEILSIKPKWPANVLLLGPIMAGKSSFINSILTIAKGRSVNKAGTGSKETSFTTAFDQFNGEGILQHCCLCDSMGIEQVLEDGLFLDDLEYLLKGHIEKGYKFNPRSKISESDAHFRRKPKIEHGIHCVVFVLDACMVAERSVEPFMPKIRDLLDQIRLHNVPYILILTKIDQICQKVNDDVGNTFWSVKVRDAVTFAAEMFGIPERDIHPIKNLVKDNEIDDAATNLLLIALKQIMHYASDRIEDLKNGPKKDCIVS